MIDGINEWMNELLNGFLKIAPYAFRFFPVK